MYFHHQDGGFYWHQIMTYPAVWSYHWPGFPSAEAQREIGIMQAMREAAFKIQGLPVPPVPVPDAPELLPIGDVPLLIWRGSAGASGYDIERAPQAAGPWTALATNVCDADIAYRPLFSDTTARAGQTWFYRVIARNASGASKPSNVVGPVAVKRVCLADELQDFSRVHAKSAGLKLNNDYNALYAEYLFRAQGSTNDWITYQVPAAIESVKVVAFFAKEDRRPDAASLRRRQHLHRAQAGAKGAPSAQPARRRRRRPAPHDGRIRMSRPRGQPLPEDPLERPGRIGPCGNLTSVNQMHNHSNTFNPMNQENLLQKEAKMMKLEKLIAERETISTKPFPVPVKELLQRYEQLYTGAISDVLREFCLLDQALPGHLRPLRDSDVVAGIAFTVKSAPNVKITGELTFRTQMLDEMGEDAFVVWDTSNDEKATLWGGVMTATAYGKGVKAACIDGGIRDTKQILEKPFPVYYKHRIPNGSLGRCLITHYQVPDQDRRRGDQAPAT